MLRGPRDREVGESEKLCRREVYKEVVLLLIESKECGSVLNDMTPPVSSFSFRHHMNRCCFTLIFTD
jgi:hypothetical protein